jgi:CheY-like chemotaxis protein
MRRRLLCVDDDSAFRQFYKNLLGSYGYDVTVAASGRQALRVLLSHKVDVVLTDMEMPGMTGAELAIRLKKMRPELPVLLVSGAKAQAPGGAIDASVPKGSDRDGDGEISQTAADLVPTALCAAGFGAGHHCDCRLCGAAVVEVGDQSSAQKAVTWGTNQLQNLKL